MFDPATADPEDKTRTMTELMKLRADVARALETAEAEWLELSETLEAA